MRARFAWLWLALSPGCDRPDPVPPATEQPAFAPGVVLAVDGIGIEGSDLEPLEEALAEIYPDYTLPHLRRLALTNVHLPRAVVHSRFEDPRRESRAQADRALASLADYQGPGAEPDWTDFDGERSQQEGGWQDLGIELWSAARGQPVGAWVGPFDLIGRWTLVRVDAIEGEGARARVRLSRVDFRYLPATTVPRDIDRLIDRSKLTILSPEWEDYVPESWKYRMQGEGS